METIEFIALIGSFAVVMVWYLQNATSDGDGCNGILALVNDPEISKRASYRIKPRTTRRNHETQIHDQRDGKHDATASPQRQTTYNAMDEQTRMRNKFRRQDETRYKVKNRKPRGLGTS